MAAILLAAGPAHAAPPGAQVLGPAWLGQRLSITGDVLAVESTCAQINVVRHGMEGFGRAWLCWPSSAGVPALGTRVHASGQVRSMRMTRMGQRWRPVPVINIGHPAKPGQE